MRASRAIDKSSGGAAKCPDLLVRQVGSSQFIDSSSVADYYRLSLTGIQNQVARLGGSLSEAELIAYIARNGPTSGFAPESGDATNPFRPKAWHLGRVKYFYERFKSGAAVEPILIHYHPRVGWHVGDGSHRLLGAFFTGQGEIAATFTPDATRRHLNVCLQLMLLSRQRSSQ
jgi:hypothetical protein